MRKKIGELLVEAGAATADDVKMALGNQRTWGAGQKLGQVLVAMGTCKPEQVARALALQFDLPYIELPQISSSVSSMVPIDFQTEHKIVPFKLEVEGRVERLHLAVADPADLELVDELRFQLGKPIKVFVAASNDIDEVLSALRGDAVAEVDALEIDDEGEELIVDRASSAVVPGGWFASDPGEDPFRVVNDVTAAQSAASGAGAAPVPVVADLPSEWDFMGGGAPAEAGGADLDDLLGGAIAVEMPAPGAQPLTKPALPPPPGAKAAEVVKFAKGQTPPGGLPAITAPSAPPAPSPNGAPVFGGAAAGTARGSGSFPAISSEASATTMAPHAPASNVAPAPMAPVIPITASVPVPPPSNVAPAPAAAVVTPPAQPPAPVVTAPAPTPPPVPPPAPVTAAPAVPSAPEASAAPTSPDRTVTPLANPALALPPTRDRTVTPLVTPVLPSAPPADEKERIEFSDADLAILENLERMAAGEDATIDSSKVKPAQMVASLIRLLMKKGVIAETEFLEELARK